MLLTGYVAAVTDFGVFVGFLNHCTGLAPRAQLCDMFVLDPRDHFTLGQSVRARVTAVSSAEEQESDTKNKLILSLKPSKILNKEDLVSASSPEALFVKSFFSEAKLLEDFACLKSGNGVNENLSMCKVGARVQGVVEKVKSVGLALELDTSSKKTPKKKAKSAASYTASNVKAFVPRPYHTEEGTDAKNFERGQNVQGRVLTVDRSNNVCEVSFILKTENRTCFLQPLII